MGIGQRNVKLAWDIGTSSGDQWDTAPIVEAWTQTKLMWGEEIQTTGSREFLEGQVKGYTPVAFRVSYKQMDIADFTQKQSRLRFTAGPRQDVVITITSIEPENGSRKTYIINGTYDLMAPKGQVA